MFRGVESALEFHFFQRDLKRLSECKISLIPRPGVKFSEVVKEAKEKGFTELEAQRKAKETNFKAKKHF